MPEIVFVNTELRLPCNFDLRIVLQSCKNRNSSSDSFLNGMDRFNWLIQFSITVTITRCANN